MLLFTACTWGFATHPVKRAVAVCVSLVNAVAFATYASHCAGITYALPTMTPGDVMEPFRILQWCFTTPMLIVVLACIAGDGPVARRTVAAALATDWAMLAFGFAERYVAGGALRGVLFAASGAAFAVAMHRLRMLFSFAAAAVSAPEDAESLAMLWRHTIRVWCGFPIARLLRIGGVLGPNGEEVSFALLDIAAKTCYACWMLTCSFGLLDSLTARRLARCDELIMLIRGHEEGPSRLARSLAAAYREAGGFVGAAPCPFAAEPPTNEQEALLDAAVREYVALAQGRSDAWAPPSPMPPAFNFAGSAGGVLPAL
jgi:bacteriorhodopsin